MAVLGFGKKKTATSQELSRQEITQQTAEETQRQISEQEQISEQIGVTSALDVETQELVKNLIADISLDIGDTGELDDLVSVLLGRATTAQEDVSAQISPIIEGARAKGETELQKLQTQLAQQSGGSIANTLVASSTAVGRADLETQLARTAGELNLSARQQVSNELISAIGGITQAQQAPIQNITDLLGILKGASVEQQQTGTQRTTAESELARLLDSLTETDIQQRATATEKSSSIKLGFGN